jgi:hypothetical protein
MRSAVTNLQKDVRIVLDVARGKRAPEPAVVVDLAKRSLMTLTNGDQTSDL